MTETEFRQELKGSLSGAYIFFGDEEYLKSFYLLRAKAVALGEGSEFEEWNYHIIEGKKSKNGIAALDSLKEAIYAVPMMAPKVFVRYFADLSLYTSSEIDELLDLLSEINTETTVLIIYTPENGIAAGDLKKVKSCALYKKLDKATKSRCVELFKMNNTELKKWIARRLGKEKIAISPFSAETLIARVGSSMYDLAGELEKLCAYAKANGLSEITDVEISFVACLNKEDEAFALSNAILAGDRKKALNSLYIYKNAREEPVKILGLISKSLTEMLTVLSLMTEGAQKPEISAQTKIHEYKVGLIMASVRNQKPERLVAAINRLREADIAAKSGVDGYIALERFICTIPIKR